MERSKLERSESSTRKWRWEMKFTLEMQRDAIRLEYNKMEQITMRRSQHSSEPGRFEGRIESDFSKVKGFDKLQERHPKSYFKE